VPVRGGLHRGIDPVDLDPVKAKSILGGPI
jgi:hypothetical protein